MVENYKILQPSQKVTFENYCLKKKKNKENPETIKKIMIGKSQSLMREIMQPS